MKTKTHFAFRIDIWDDTGDSIVEHVAGVDDFEVAEATYRAAVARWPTARIRLRQGARVVHESAARLCHFETTLFLYVLRRHPRPSVVASGQNHCKRAGNSIFLRLFLLVAMITLLYASAGGQNVLARRLQ